METYTEMEQSRQALPVRVTVLRSIAEIERARPAWVSLQAHPNADIDWFLREVTHSEGAVEPCALLATQGDEPVALMVGRVETIRLELRFGYLRLARPAVRALSFIAGCVPVDADAPTSTALFDAILETLRRGEVSVARLFNLPLDSELYRLARTRPGRGERDGAVRPVGHWKIRLPETGDAFFRRLKEKHRRPLRRMCRLIESPNELGLTYRRFHRPEHVDLFAAQAEAITRRSYLRSIGAGFTDSPLMRSRLAYAASRGEWCAFVLYAGDTPCAFWTGTLYGGVFHAQYTGRDPAFAQYNPGTGMILFAKLIEYLCDTAHARELDFGIGDYAYKERFGDVNREEATLFVFAPDRKGRALNRARNGLASVESLARRAVDRLGARERLKRLWRRRLSGTSTKTGGDGPCRD